MRKCPVCKKNMNRRKPSFLLGRYLTRCPHCGAVLRKKLSIWFTIIVVLWAVCAANFKTHEFFVVATIVGCFIIIAFLYKLPYEPYYYDDHDKR